MSGDSGWAPQPRGSCSSGCATASQPRPCWGVPGKPGATVSARVIVHSLALAVPAGTPRRRADNGDLEQGNVACQTPERVSQDFSVCRAADDLVLICGGPMSPVNAPSEPQSGFDEAYRATKPGGLLLFRDLARPVDKNTLDRSVQHYPGNPKEHQQQLPADSLAAPLTIEEITEAIHSVTLATNRLGMTSDWHRTWVARKA